MPIRTTIIVLFISLMISLVAADLHDSFSLAMNKLGNEETLCVKNYDAGAVITESYRNFEHLDKDTQIVSRSYNSSSIENGYTLGKASLEATLNSNVIGNAHLDWQSKDIVPNSFGRHAFISGSSEDVTGVFSINKFIQLWSNSTLLSGGVEWLP